MLKFEVRIDPIRLDIEYLNVILNATDMVTGEHFEFTQNQFDFLGSDLTTYQVGRAAAASSAFPFLFTPLTLVNRGPLSGDGWPLLEYTNALAAVPIVLDHGGHGVAPGVG